MGRWQHLLHFFSIHDWHETRREDNQVELVGHGPHVPQRCITVTTITKKCCHCGIEAEKSGMKSKMESETEWFGL